MANPLEDEMPASRLKQISLMTLIVVEKLHTATTPITLAQLVDMTGLTRTGAIQSVEPLVQRGLLVETMGKNSMGRGTARQFQFAPALLQNLAGLSFGTPVVLLTSQPMIPSHGIATGDLDGDTWPDLAVTYDGLPPVLFYNTGSGLSSYGSSCDAQGFTTPHTVGIGQPTLGNANFAIGLDGATPNGLGLLWLGLDNRFAFGVAQLPFDLARFGAPGCAVVASTEAPAFVLADAQGHASLPLPIPNATALQRVVLFAQGAVAAPGANALGWLFANGLAVKIP